MSAPADPAEAPAIPFVREMEIEYGRADRVSPRVQRVVARNPGPFTYRGTGTYIVGDETVAVIDPGPALDEHLHALLAALDARRVSHILTTHTHADHSPLARALQAAVGGVVLGRAAPTDLGAEEAQDAGFVPDEAVAEGQVISGPGWSLEAMETPGHASNHVAYALREENALFCGDHVMGWSTTVISPPDGDMGDYYASLEKVAAREFDVLWPTHGPPVREAAPFLTAYAGHRRAREAQIVQALKAGPSTVAALVSRLYRGLDPRLHAAAARSVLAHLILLVRQGVAAAEGPSPMTARYRYLNI